MSASGRIGKKRKARFKVQGSRFSVQGSPSCSSRARSASVPATPSPLGGHIEAQPAWSSDGTTRMFSTVRAPRNSDIESRHVHMASGANEILIVDRRIDLEALRRLA